MADLAADAAGDAAGGGFCFFRFFGGFGFFFAAGLFGGFLGRFFRGGIGICRQAFIGGVAVNRRIVFTGKRTCHHHFLALMRLQGAKAAFGQADFYAPHYGRRAFFIKDGNKCLPNAQRTDNRKGIICVQAVRGSGKRYAARTRY